MISPWLWRGVHVNGGPNGRYAGVTGDGGAADIRLAPSLHITCDAEVVNLQKAWPAR